MEQQLIIGNQIWMPFNLNIRSFQNGDELLFCTSNEEWLEAQSKKIPACCNYDFDISYDEIHGKIYNWHAVSDERKIAPLNWEIPTNEDWTELEDFLGGHQIAGGKLKSKKFWPKLQLLNIDQNGTDDFNFAAMPSGYLWSQKKYIEFEQLGKLAVFWSQSKVDNQSVKIREIKSATFFGKNDLRLYEKNCPIENGYYIRCIQK